MGSRLQVGRIGSGPLRRGSQPRQGKDNRFGPMSLMSHQPSGVCCSIPNGARRACFARATVGLLATAIFHGVVVGLLRCEGNDTGRPWVAGTLVAVILQCKRNAPVASEVCLRAAEHGGALAKL